MSKQAGAKFSTLLGLLEEEELGELPDDGSLGAEDVLHDLYTLISAHQVEEDLERLEEGGGGRGERRGRQEGAEERGGGRGDRRGQKREEGVEETGGGRRERRGQKREEGVEETGGGRGDRRGQKREEGEGGGKRMRQ